MKNMSKNKKGFTLVELLAVIVILAIIAVIAVPSVLKIISGAREDAKKASAKSALKAAQIAVAQGVTGGDLSNLGIDNNPYKYGTWSYNSELKKIIFEAGRDAEEIEDSTYVISGSQDEIMSGEIKIIKPSGGITLASKMNNTALGETPVGSFDNTTGYIKGTNPNNYVRINTSAGVKDFRAVKVNEDGSILLVANFNIGNIQYNTIYTDNNFAVSPIRDALTTFYNTITTKSLIKYNNWDTRCSADGTMEQCQAATTKTESIIDKVGLLTLEDYVAVAGVGVLNYERSNNYLSNGSSWLGTGYSLGGSAWYVTDSDYGFADTSSVGSDIGVRPADSFETEVYELKGLIEKPWETSINLP